MKGTKQTSFWFDEKLYKNLKIQALMRDSTITEVVQDACRDWLKKNSKEYKA